MEPPLNKDSERAAPIESKAEKTVLGIAATEQRREIEGAKEALKNSFSAPDYARNSASMSSISLMEDFPCRENHTIRSPRFRRRKPFANDSQKP